MNYRLIVLIKSVLFISFVAQAKVPKSWIQASETGTALWSESLQNESAEGFGKELFNFYEVTGDLVQGLPQPNKAKLDKEPWYLQSMGMELGIEVEGAIGLVGLGGEAAIEMVWARTKESVARLQKKHFPDPQQTQTWSVESELGQSDLLLSTDLADSTIEKHVDELMGVLKNTQNILNPKRMRESLIQEVQKIKKWVTTLEVSLPNSTWRPYKFQNLIKLSAQGMVQPGLEVGGTIIVKLEWMLRQRKPPATKLSLLEIRNGQFLQGLASDFEVLQPLSDPKEYYKLTNVKLGIGLGIEGDMGVAEGEAEVFGNLFWKEFPKTSTMVFSARSEQPMGLVNSTGNFTEVKRSLWHKGLNKAKEISSFVVKTATDYEKKKEKENSKEERDFELAFLEVEFEVSASGSTFLPTLAKKGTADLYFVKSNRL